MTTDRHAAPPGAMDDRSSSPEGGRGGLRRRDLLVGIGGIAAGVAGTFGGVEAADTIRAAVEDARTDAATATSKSTLTLDRFASTMLTAPRIGQWRRAGTTTAPGLLFATPRSGEFTPVVYDQDGHPVWIAPDGETATDLRVQRYRGADVITYWAGRTASGNGNGRGVVLDSSYRTITEVHAGNGLLSDLHEFELTDAGTALVTVYPITPADLTAVDGPSDGWMFDCHVQEIDIASGDVLLDWRASDHLDLGESYEAVGATGVTPDDAYDPFHTNAISADSTDTLLLSARHTHTIYSLDRATGAVRWRLGGKRTDFTVSDDAAFAWQHHARRRSATTISMFDNHTRSTTGTSRGLLLTVDEDARTARLAEAYAHRDHVGTAMGSMQVLPNGNVLVGWGMQPAATEFTADGTAIWEASGIGTICYRVARHEWTGTPVTAPAVSVRTTGSGRIRVAMSWNGATEVASWRVMTGADPTTLAASATPDRTGFETAVTVDRAEHVQVVAVDAAGAALASSRVVAV